MTRMQRALESGMAATLHWRVRDWRDAPHPDPLPAAWGEGNRGLRYVAARARLRCTRRGCRGTFLASRRARALVATPASATPLRAREADNEIGSIARISAASARWRSSSCACD